MPNPSFHGGFCLLYNFEFLNSSLFVGFVVPLHKGTTDVAVPEKKGEVVSPTY